MPISSHTKRYRAFIICCMLLVICYSTCIVVNAQVTDDVIDNIVDNVPTEAPVSPDGNISDMMTQVLDWYKLIRKIAVPILIVSYASCGFTVLFSAYMERGEKARDSVRKHIMESTVALLILTLLPKIIDETIGLVKSSAWQPPGT